MRSYMSWNNSEKSEQISLATRVCVYIAGVKWARFLDSRLACTKKKAKLKQQCFFPPHADARYWNKCRQISGFTCVNSLPYCASGIATPFFVLYLYLKPCWWTQPSTISFLNTCAFTHQTIATAIVCALYRSAVFIHLSMFISNEMARYPVLYRSCRLLLCFFKSQQQVRSAVTN